MRIHDQTLSLTPWQLTYLHPDAVLTPAALNEAQREWRAAAVPGAVQTSPFGLPLDMLYQRDAIDTVRWMDAMYWVFRTTFTAPAVGEDEEAVYLFTGIDYQCRIWLNGKLITDHEGMFSPVEIPLQAETQCELLVVLAPFTAGEGAPEVLKARYSFGSGWDFAPEVQSRGIWNDAGILVRPRLRVTGAAVQTVLANQQRVEATVRLDLSERVTYGEVTVTLDGVRRTFPVVNADRLALPLNIPSPTLWWPNGLGAPNLTDLTVELRVPGRTTTTFTRRVGLRAIEKIPCDGQRVEDTPLQLVINGCKVFMKGVNWVPPEALAGEITTEHYARILPQFQAGGVNLVRVWGGGLAEKDAFYDLADALGLMVLQEFPLACQTLARTEKFYRLLQQEVPAIIQRLAHHPCVVIWCGGNEHYHYWDNLDSGSARMNAMLPELLTEDFNFHTNREWRGGAETYNEPALALMGELCARLDPSRPYQLTSGMEGEGDIHGIWNWNPAIGDWRYRDYDTLYDYWLSTKDHLFSEASVSAIANTETIAYVLGNEAPGYPADKSHPIWRKHHAFGAAWQHLDDLWLDIPSTAALFGEIDDLETLILANQWMQGEGGRFLIEETRRKMGHTCGVIWWGANEPWPGMAGNALIDYFGRAKLGWQLIANAYQPSILSLRYAHCVARRIKPELWITHDGPESFAGRYAVTAENLLTGEIDRYEGQIYCTSMTAVPVRTLLPVRMTAGTRVQITCRLFAGETPVHRNDYLFASSEDAVPFDRQLVERIKALYGAASPAPA